MCCLSVSFFRGGSFFPRRKIGLSKNEENCIMKLLGLIFVFICILTTYAAQHDESSFFASNQELPNRYIIKNSFEKILKFGKIRTSCTCADVKYLKSELQPGESTELIVTLKANSLSGPFTHTIYVETDNPKQRFMRFVIKGNAIPLLKVSPGPVRYIGTLQAGKMYEYKYELIPTDPKEKISLELNHPKLPDGTDIKLEKQENKFLLTVWRNNSENRGSS